ncbi:MAG: zinc-ribbon domain-containing protein [Candidatus Korobacteraceae bacterium]
MLCSNCGFENPADHRFCGMCGTPLPQRPIIAPGAQSTADLTRHPVEVSTASSLSNLSTASATQTHTSGTAGPNYFSQAEQAESLDQFIAGFHYTPPTEEDEVTMTGDKPVLDGSTSYEPAAPISLSEAPSVSQTPAKTTEPLRTPVMATEIVPPAEESVEQPPLIVTEPPPFATKGIKDQAPERSRFLDDLAEPAKKAPPTTAATSIGGPSFLGLSDTPATPAYVGDGGEERRSHWRAWMAVIVICVFAGLGILEWRAEKQQSNNGPIGIMKMQIERLKGKKAVITPPPSSEASTESAAPGTTSQPNASGPQMQVVPQQKPQAPSPQPGTNQKAPQAPANPGAASNAAAAESPSAKVQQSPTAKSSTADNGAAVAQKTQSPVNAKSENATSANSAPQSETAGSESEKAAKATPGAEELAKAASASDAPAASAWLWKAVAKGNPEAPIKLANMYIKGDGVPQSCDQALILLRSAAAKENAAARSRLGSLYASGTCVARNRVKAYQYMSQALEANPNAVWARDFRQQLWIQMTPQERQQAQNAQ